MLSVGVGGVRVKEDVDLSGGGNDGGGFGGGKTRWWLRYRFLRVCRELWEYLP